MQKYLLLLFLFICASCIGSKNGILEQNKTFDKPVIAYNGRQISTIFSLKEGFGFIKGENSSKNVFFFHSSFIFITLLPFSAYQHARDVQVPPYQGVHESHPLT